MSKRQSSHHNLKHNIEVANNARVKRKHLPLKGNSMVQMELVTVEPRKEKVKIENKVIEGFLGSGTVLISDIAKDSALDPVPVKNVCLLNTAHKKELCGIKNSSKAFNTEKIILKDNNVQINNVYSTKQSNAYIALFCNENLENNRKESILHKVEKSRVKDENSCYQATSNFKRVKNPFVFHKADSKPLVASHELTEKRLELQDDFFYKIKKSENILIDEYFENERSFNISIAKENAKGNENMIKKEAEQLLETCSSNSSLSVNLSDVDSHFDGEIFIPKHSIKNSSLSTKLVPANEIFSAENVDLSQVASHLTEGTETLKQQKLYDSSLCRSYKLGQKRNYQNKNREKCNELKERVADTVEDEVKRSESKKFVKKDYLFTAISKKNVIKNLPKTDRNTRKIPNKSITETTVTTTKKAFSKIFKFEAASTGKMQDLAVELPNSMKCTNENYIEYWKPQYQPIIRLRRLKSKELLTALRNKKFSKSRKLKDVSSNLISQSLDWKSYNEVKHLSIDHDHSYSNNQLSCTMSVHSPNHSFTETVIKSFSPQKRFPFCHSSTPKHSSILSCHNDSGISTTTNNMFSPSLNNKNALLLEIAAERTSINNHLIRFGYSPIQFDLFNDFNDLKVFLKYLLGNLQTN